MTDAERLRDYALQIAAGEVGVRETGRNRGIRVEAYQAAAGGLPGEAYCVDFILWAYTEACHGLTLPMPLPAFRGALNLWRHTPPATHWHQPTPGAIFIHDHGGGMGHAGFVESVRGDGTFLSIEANTSPSPGVPRTDRDGDGVYRRHDRHVGDPRLVGFVDTARVGP